MTRDGYKSQIKSIDDVRHLILVLDSMCVCLFVVGRMTWDVLGKDGVGGVLWNVGDDVYERKSV